MQGRRDVTPRAAAAKRGAEPVEAGTRPDRRSDILEASERLFAERGYASVSIRDIAAAAAVPIALVRYYFGRKEELLSFIFERHREEIDERVSGIAGVEGPPGPARAERVIRAWAEPVLERRATQAESAFSVLVARSIWEAGDENRRIVERFYDPLARSFVVAMGQALPHVDEATIVWAYGWALGALLTFIADTRVERLSNGSERAADPRRSEDLLRFMTAGLLAATGRDRRPERR